MNKVLVSAAPTTLDALESQAESLIQDLANVQNRVEGINDAMNGNRPPTETETGDGDKACGSVNEISRRLNNSSNIIAGIKETLSEIESVVLSDKAVACKA